MLTLTDSRVVKLSIAKSVNDGICVVRPMVFRNYLDKCFGSEFRQRLTTSYDDNTYASHDDTKSYNIGQRVSYQGKIKESTVDGNTNYPYQDGWQEINCFDDPCLSWIWVTYLEPWLAHLIFAESVAYITEEKITMATKIDMQNNSFRLAEEVMACIEDDLKKKIDEGCEFGDIEFLSRGCGCNDLCDFSYQNRVAYRY